MVSAIQGTPTGNSQFLCPWNNKRKAEGNR